MRKRIGKFIGLILTMSMILCVSTSAFAAENDYLHDNDVLGKGERVDDYSVIQEIESFVKSYYRIIDDSFSTLCWIDGAEKYFENGLSNFDYVIYNTNIEYRKNQSTDLKYKEYTSTIQFESIEKYDDVFIVGLIKDTKIQYACLRDEWSEEIFEHEVVIRKSDNDGYLVIEDNYSDNLREEFFDVNNELKLDEFCAKVLEKSEISLETDKDSVIMEEKNAKEKAYVDSDRGNSVVMASSFSKHNYDRTAAKNYAYKYVLSPNSSYGNYESLGGNCTNFTSQCLKAGGICSDKTGNYTWYYSSSSDRAPSWTSANEFRKYYRNNVGSSSIKGLHAKSCTFSETRLGDLIQNVNDSGRASHTMFISSAIYDNWASDNPWEYKYDVGICQNSTGSSGRLKNVPLSSRSTSLNREYIHITSSYY